MLRKQLALSRPRTLKDSYIKVFTHQDRRYWQIQLSHKGRLGPGLEVRVRVGLILIRAHKNGQKSIAHFNISPITHSV